MTGVLNLWNQFKRGSWIVLLAGGAIFAFVAYVLRLRKQAQVLQAKLDLARTNCDIEFLEAHKQINDAALQTNATAAAAVEQQLADLRAQSAAKAKTLEKITNAQLVDDINRRTPGGL